MTLTSSDLHHRVASSLALLGAAAPLRSAPFDDDFAVILTWAGEPEQPLGTWSVEQKHPHG